MTMIKDESEFVRSKTEWRFTWLVGACSDEGRMGGTRARAKEMPFDSVVLIVVIFAARTGDKRQFFVRETHKCVPIPWLWSQLASHSRAREALVFDTWVKYMVR